jgi:hypothetical protein
MINTNTMKIYTLQVTGENTSNYAFTSKAKAEAKRRELEQENEGDGNYHVGDVFVHDWPTTSKGLIKAFEAGCI